MVSWTYSLWWIWNVFRKKLVAINMGVRGVTNLQRVNELFFLKL